jgi:2-polyprenyl-6-methoxyphenol hydroxylase-like FAD-dependent oxidoreductase
MLAPRTSSAPVAIVGAGPVGLSLAVGLARHGVRAMVFEREPTTGDRSRAAGIHLRTREVFRHWSIEDRFLEAGELLTELVVRDAGADDRAVLAVDFDELRPEADQPGVLILEQSETERLLLDAAREAGQQVRFGTEVIALRADADGVTLTLDEGGSRRTFDAAYVVGCDGASSTVRDALDLPFEGRTYELRPMLADVDLDDERGALPSPRIENGRGGLTLGIRLRPGRWRIVHLTAGPEPSAGVEVPAVEVERRVEEVLGPGPVRIVWSSRFRIHRRSSPRFRVGRVLLAGDAAHVHSPVGGQGMNAGIQDTHNLAWKLAAALEGGEVDRLLDSYDVERRAVVVGTVSGSTDLVTRLYLQSPSWVRSALFTLQRTVLRFHPIRRRFLRRATMLDLDLPASPLLDADERAAGLRLPDPLLRAPDGGPVRLYDLLPTGPLLLRVGGPARPDGEGSAMVGESLRIGRDGHQDPTGVLRDLLGGPEGWILVRPDAHVAWARTDPAGLRAAARAALGQPPGSRARNG